MTKELRKSIMKCSRLRNRLNREKILQANLAYKYQRNKCTKLLRQAKKAYYGALKPETIKDNKKFWKSVKPLFTDKVQANIGIALA